MMRWPMGSSGDVVERFTRCFGFFLERALALGLVWEGVPALGAAVWMAPEQTDSSSAQHPWNQARIGAIAEDGGRYERFWAWVEQHNPDTPMWQLDSLAVDPAAQGGGVGSALVSAGLRCARAQGLGAFLSTGTARNVSIYQRCGFRVAEEHDAPDGGPHVWFMRAEA